MTLIFLNGKEHSPNNYYFWDFKCKPIDLSTFPDGTLNETVLLRNLLENVQNFETEVLSNQKDSSWSKVSNPSRW